MLCHIGCLSQKHKNQTLDQEPPPCGVRCLATSNLAQGISLVKTSSEINRRYCTFNGQKKHLAVLRCFSYSEPGYQRQQVSASKPNDPFQTRPSPVNVPHFLWLLHHRLTTAIDEGPPQGPCCQNRHPRRQDSATGHTSRHIGLAQWWPPPTALHPILQWSPWFLWTIIASDNEPRQPSGTPSLCSPITATELSAAPLQMETKLHQNALEQCHLGQATDYYTRHHKTKMLRMPFVPEKTMAPQNGLNCTIKPGKDPSLPPSSSQTVILNRRRASTRAASREPLQKTKDLGERCSPQHMSTPILYSVQQLIMNRRHPCPLTKIPGSHDGKQT